MGFIAHKKPFDFSHSVYLLVSCVQNGRAGNSSTSRLNGGKNFKKCCQQHLHVSTASHRKPRTMSLDVLQVSSTNIRVEEL